MDDPLKEPFLQVIKPERMTDYGITVQICPNCQDKFLPNHNYYRPKVKYVEDGAILYCSDACFRDINKDTKGACGCELRKLVLTEGRRGDKWLCSYHSMVFDMEVKNEPKADDIRDVKESSRGSELPDVREFEVRDIPQVEFQDI